MISTEVEEDEQEITFGQKLADKVAEFGEVGDLLSFS